MRPYAIVLFVHVMCAIGLFIGLALEGLVSVRIQWADEVEEVRWFVRILERLRWIFIPSFAGLLLGGGYLASEWVSATVWIPAAVGATLAIMLVGGLVTGRETHQLKIAVGRRDAKPHEPFISRGIGTRLTVSYGLRTGLSLGIVFLMTAKPTLWPSTLALVAGCIAGLFMAVSLQTFARRAGHECDRWRRLPLPDAPTASSH